MNVTIIAFAGLKEYLPPRFEVELPRPEATVQTLKQELLHRYPQAEGLLRVSRAAMEQVIVDDIAKVTDHGIIYLIPPASGG